MNGIDVHKFWYMEQLLMSVLQETIEKQRKEKKGLHGNRTRDLSHPKRESYH